MEQITMYKCTTCNKLFKTNHTCLIHEIECNKTLSFEKRNALIADASKSVIDDLINDPKKIIDDVISYLKEIGKNDDVDLTDYGFSTFFELIVEAREDKLVLHKDVKIRDIINSCIYELEDRIYNK